MNEAVAGRHNNVKVGVAGPVDEDGGVGVAVGCVTCDEIKRLGPRVSLCIVYQIERMGRNFCVNSRSCALEVRSCGRRSVFEICGRTVVEKDTGATEDI